MQAFPEALFYQLLLVMVYPDKETRIGAHRVFSVVLVPSSVCPRPSRPYSDPSRGNYFQRTLSRTVSVFSSSAALFEKLRREKSSLRESSSSDSFDKAFLKEDNLQLGKDASQQSSSQSVQSQAFSFEGSLPLPEDGKTLATLSQELVSSMDISK